MMTEAELQELLTDAATWGGWRWCHFRPARTVHGWRTALSGNQGWPDLTLVRDGRMVCWELKSARGIVHVEQAEWLRVLGQVPGIDARVIRPVDADWAVATLLAKPAKKTA